LTEQCQLKVVLPYNSSKCSENSKHTVLFPTAVLYSVITERANTVP